MLASLLTQLLGKGAEAMLMHAKACNLPLWQCWCVRMGATFTQFRLVGLHRKFYTTL